MYDFWYTLGVAAIEPNLLTAIKNAGPVFNLVDRKVVENIGGQEFVRRGPSTGLLDRAATTKVRLAISQYIKGLSWSAPPIGIYTAGRFSQLVKISLFQSDKPDSTFADIINSAHKAYVTALASGAASSLPTFPAILGMCLMDGKIVDRIQKWPNLSQSDLVELAEILQEFGLTIGDRSWDIARAFVKDNADFKAAVFYLMAGNMNPWFEKGNTLEQMLFWPDDTSGKGEHAIP